MDRESNKELADRLRGRAMNESREAGKQLVQQQVSQPQVAQEISGPRPTPGMGQTQTTPVRERHVAEKASPAPPQAGKDKSLAEIARDLRQAGVTGGRAANDISPAKHTPAVEQKQSKGRGR